MKNPEPLYRPISFFDLNKRQRNIYERMVKFNHMVLEEEEFNELSPGEVQIFERWLKDAAVVRLRDGLYKGRPFNEVVEEIEYWSKHKHKIAIYWAKQIVPFVLKGLSPKLKAESDI